MPGNLQHLDTGLLVEAEDFDDFGGWVLDSQFETIMGSPYLMAHGLGRPVEDATTTVHVPQARRYHLWVRAKDWVPGYHPGRFQLFIDGTCVETEFGANDEDWMWQSGGEVHLKEGAIRLALHELTGFNGRCDAIYFGRDAVPPPSGVAPVSAAWRKRLKGLPAEPVAAGDFDVVVVGGGISGCATALASARLGLSVALIHDRPVLGGNASIEIGLMPRGTQGKLLKELSERGPGGDIRALALLAEEPTAEVFLEHRVQRAVTEDGVIRSIDAVCAKGGIERRFNGKMFIDASGIALFGKLAGAQTMFGREARSEFGEPLAPETADEMHHGNTLFFRTKMADGAVPFPEVPWAIEVAKDYANLSGQLIEPGLENGPGPSAGDNPATPEFRFGRKGDIVPATHFWEYGQWLDPYTSGEQVRDYLMRALFGAFSNVKKLEPKSYANLAFEWMAFVAAQGEFARYRGNYVLSENDIRDHTMFDDALIANDGSFCIHCAWEPGEGKYDFRLKDWIFDQRDKQPYAIPFRCLYSSNISNLMFAGKHISVTHVAGSATKLMGNGAQHGVAVAAAAALCRQYGVSPRELYAERFEELQSLVRELTDCDHDMTSHPPTRNYAPVPG